MPVKFAPNARLARASAGAFGRPLLVSFFAVLLGACGAPEAPVEVDAAGRPVKLIEVGGSQQRETLSFPAVLDATRVSALSFLVGGVIVEVPVEQAQAVEEGDVLVRLDPADFESNVTSARASFTNANDEFERAQRLLEADAIARSVVEQRESQRDVARAQLELAEKALRDSVLRAPFTGIVAAVPASVGETAAPGSAAATVIDASRLDATINLPASLIARAPTAETTPAAVRLEALPGRTLVAEFKNAQLIADATSQTYAVTFSFTPPEDVLLLPGMNATIELSPPSQADTASVAVPLAAVQSDGEGQYVWVVDQASMAIARRDISVAAGIGETIVVTAGLERGETIVGAGAAYLTDGAKVTPWVE